MFVIGKIHGTSQPQDMHLLFSEIMSSYSTKIDGLVVTSTMHESSCLLIDFYQLSVLSSVGAFDNIGSEEKWYRYGFVLF